MLVWTSSNALQILRWGYQKWNHKGRVLHARWETAGTSIFFHQNHSRRGILCVSGYFEWSTQKEQYYFHRQSPLYLGILYNDQGEFVILTVAAMMPYQRIHPRMPVVFSRQQAYDFLEHQPIKKEALDLHVSKVQ